MGRSEASRAALKLQGPPWGLAGGGGAEKRKLARLAAFARLFRHLLGVRFRRRYEQRAPPKWKFGLGSAFGPARANNGHSSTSKGKSVEKGFLARAAFSPNNCVKGGGFVFPISRTSRFLDKWFDHVTGSPGAN